jgi:hypothetical protein
MAHGSNDWHNGEDYKNIKLAVSEKISVLLLATRNAIILLGIAFFIGVYATGLSL